MENEIYSRALMSLPFDPLPEQEEALGAMSRFVASEDPAGIFVLNGYAGTGKTSLVGALVKAMEGMKRRVVVLSPTGRGAQVASGLSAHPAGTIHRRLFRPDPADPSGARYVTAPNQLRDTLFVVDEASMIADTGANDPSSLLNQLVRHVYSSPGCRILMMGDEAQLPPVGQRQANAMRPERLAAMGLNPDYHVLEIPMRQGLDSGIIHNATMLRHWLLHPGHRIDPHIDADGYDDVNVVSGRDLPDVLADSYAAVGRDDTIIITRANWRANEFNKAIRSMVFYAEEPLERGDRLVIAKNDYFWGRQQGNKGGLIANGDIAEVTWTGSTEKAYGRYFTEVELDFGNGRLVNALLMLRSLMAKGPALPREEMERFGRIIANEADGVFSEKWAAMLNSPYYNALQAKYAYCVTCHKAQGGQWRHVYIDMAGIDPAALDDDFYRWAYTAITRATEKVFFIDPPFPVR